MDLKNKLLTIRQSVEYIQKTEKGNQGAMYVDPAVLLKTIRDKMNELKILLVPFVQDCTMECIDFPTANNPNAKCFVFSGGMSFSWVNTEEKDDNMEVAWYLAGKHMQDPAMAYGSALTYTERYFLLKFFQIPTAKDDPEFFENKTKPKEKPKQITIGAENLSALGSFCKRQDITTKKAKDDMLKHYKLDLYKNTVQEFNDIFEKIRIDHGEDITKDA